MFDWLFKDKVVLKVEKKKKLENAIELLKKEKQIQFETVVKDFDMQKINLSTEVETQIKALEAQINCLRQELKAQLALIQKRSVIELDKVINEYDQRISIKENDLNKLLNLIEADKKSLNQVIDHSLNDEVNE